MKGKIFSIFAFNKFTFGNQHVSQFVLFECKYLFSIIIFYFHKAPDGEQDRYHTHAFNALSLKLWGKYDEHILIKKYPEIFKIIPRTRVLQYFPRNSYHKIANSNGCCTILFSGPWKKTWEEFLNGETYVYNWNRNIDKNENIRRDC